MGLLGHMEVLFFSIIVCHKTLTIASCAIQQDLVIIHPMHHVCICEPQTLNPPPFPGNHKSIELTISIEHILYLNLYHLLSIKGEHRMPGIKKNTHTKTLSYILHPIILHCLNFPCSYHGEAFDKLRG